MLFPCFCCVFAVFLLCFTAAPLLEGCCTAGASLTAAAELPPGCYKICEVNFGVAQWSIVYYIKERATKESWDLCGMISGALWYACIWKMDFIGVEYGGDIRK